MAWLDQFSLHVGHGQRVSFLQPCQPHLGDGLPLDRDDFISRQAIPRLFFASQLNLCGLDRSNRAFQLLLRPLEPVTAPDAVNEPPLALEDAAAQTVAITSGPGLTIGGSITFDGQKVAVRLVGIGHGNIDEQA